jgi:hypothetical protein
MRFTDAALQAHADALRTSASPTERAIGDNFAFEARVSDARRAIYEAAGHTDLDTAHAEYMEYHVQLKDAAELPASFHASNAAATLPALADQTFVRIERLDWIALLWRAAQPGSPSLDDLLARRQAPDPGTADLLDEFIAFWNKKRGGWPMFAASLDDVRTAADAPDWAVRLRAQLGLGHFAPTNEAPRWLLAQLRYTAADVRRHAQPGQPAMFAIPTVLDGPLNPFFYPAPPPPPGLAGSCGRTVHLDNTPPLVAELLTSRIEYRLDHIHAVTWLTEPLPATAAPPRLPALRNGHLARIRAALSCPGFAEPMAER